MPLVAYYVGAGLYLSKPLGLFSLPLIFFLHINGSAGADLYAEHP